MAQISSNTLAYDQIYLKIKDFYLKEINNKFISNQERAEEYRKLLNEIHDSLGGPLVKFDPFIKGEPPYSEKFNNFTSSFARDLGLVSKQLDYLNAKTINTFNLFSLEVETEKKYVERIASKAKILQMYSKAPAEDLIYIGDSFDNADQIDITKIPIGLNPNIENGIFTLPIARVRPWNVRSVTIDTSVSNGFLGNDHQVVKAVSTDPNSDYKYVYSNNKSISSITGIGDGNPLTYFEYEGLNVDKNSNNLVNYALRSENEFCYISHKDVSPENIDGALLNWSIFDMEDPLTLKVSMENSNPSLANSITITPYFGSTNLVKVTSILATKSNGELMEILSSPIYIGSSFSSLNLEISNNYFYNKATIKFSETKVSKFQITFEQNSYQNIQIKHSYWKPNYSNESNQDSPFYGLSRFNPDALNRDIYESVQYDKYALLPEITQPNKFKDIGQASQSIEVRLKKKPIAYSGYGIVLKLIPAQLDSATPSFEGGELNVVPSPFSSPQTVYYYNWISGDTPEEDSFTYVDQLVDLFLPDDSLVEQAGSPRVFNSESEAQNDYERLQTYLNSINNILYIPQIYQYYIVDEFSIEQLTYTTTERNVTYRVPIALVDEVYNAKRKAIGIRDISVAYEVYANKAEIISTPYKFDTPIETFMLSVDSSIDNLFADKIQANYYISANNSNWIQVSPVQLYSNGIAEVLVFNKNIPTNYQIPGVAYINYPQIDKEIKDIRVRIELFKDRSVNVTPSIYSYQLMARIQK